MGRWRHLDSGVLARWKKVSDAIGISEKSYNPQARIIKDPSGNSDYTFGAILNGERDKRPMNPTVCPLCYVAEEVSGNPGRAFISESELPGFAVIPNLFPIVEGFALAIDRGFGANERNMYNTSNVAALAEEMNFVFRFSDRTGYTAAHNVKGAGASINNHEHWHLANFGAIHDRAGASCGFNVANYTTVDKGVSTADGFPFAHLIFAQNDSGRMVHFIENLGKKMGHLYDDGNVPHVIIQGDRGVLIAPAKYVERGGIGSGDAAGYAIFADKQDFEAATYDSCVRRIEGHFLKKADFNLAALL